MDGQQLSKALRTLEGRVDEAAGKQLVADHVYEIKVEMNHVEHDAICAR